MLVVEIQKTKELNMLFYIPDADANAFVELIIRAAKIGASLFIEASAKLTNSNIRNLALV